MLMRGIASFVATAAIAVAGLAGAGLRAGLAAQRVVVEGATSLTEREIHTWLRGRVPASMIEIKPAELRAALAEAIPLADVVVERRWPSTLRIVVRERQPYAMLLDDDGKAMLVDAGGRPASLRRDQAMALWDRPVIRGCQSAGPEGDYDTACAARGVAFLAWIDKAAPHWLESISELRVHGDSVVLWMSDGVRVDFGQPPFQPKLAALRYAWALAERKSLDVHHVVLTDRDTVIFRSRSQTPAAPQGHRTPAARRNHEV